MTTASRARYPSARPQSITIAVAAMLGAVGLTCLGLLLKVIAIYTGTQFTPKRLEEMLFMLVQIGLWCVVAMHARQGRSYVPFASNNLFALFSVWTAMTTVSIVRNILSENSYAAKVYIDDGLVILIWACGLAAWFMLRSGPSRAFLTLPPTPKPSAGSTSEDKG